MSPSTTSTAPRTGGPGRGETTRFRCPCGRSVVTERAETALERRCTACRRRQRPEAPLHRV